jgi:hypothetical protein
MKIGTNQSPHFFKYINYDKQTRASLISIICPFYQDALMHLTHVADPRLLPRQEAHGAAPDLSLPVRLALVVIRGWHYMLILAADSCMPQLVRSFDWRELSK